MLNSNCMGRLHFHQINTMRDGWHEALDTRGLSSYRSMKSFFPIATRMRTNDKPTIMTRWRINTMTFALSSTMWRQSKVVKRSRKIWEKKLVNQTKFGGKYMFLLCLFSSIQHTFSDLWIMPIRFYLIKEHSVKFSTQSTGNFFYRISPNQLGLRNTLLANGYHADWGNQAANSFIGL